MIDVRSALLLELARGDGHGLDLIRRISARTGGALAPGEGSAYPAIDALLADGFIVCREAPPTPRGGRPARICALSMKGRLEASALRHNLLAMVEIPAAIIATPEQIARLNELMKEEHWCPQCGEGAKAMTAERVERPESYSPILVMTCQRHGAQRHDAHDTDCWCLK